MQIPFISRTAHEAAMAALIESHQEATRQHLIDMAALKAEAEKQHALAQKELEALREDNRRLVITNHGTSKILGVLANRSPVRFLVSELRGEAPVITLKEEENSRKPTLRLVAHYPSHRSHIGRDEEVVVDPHSVMPL